MGNVPREKMGGNEDSVNLMQQISFIQCVLEMRDQGSDKVLGEVLGFCRPPVVNTESGSQASGIPRSCCENKFQGMLHHGL